MGMDELVGRRFGRLVVQGRGKSTSSGRRWFCLCDCGKTCEPFGFNLKNGETSSCGCLAKERLAEGRTRHGKARTPEYRAWETMQQRCYNPKHTSYKNYGARGILVCSRWRGPNGFENFLADLGPKPSKDHSLERRDSLKNYGPNNCCWATRIEQNNNTSRNVLLTFEGRTQTVAQWARELGVPDRLIRKRLQLGWPVQRVLQEPLNKNYVRTWRES